jgi:hypothetical protein
VDADPQNCLVWNIVAKWYEGKSCVFCRKPIGPLHRFDHAPALLGPDFKTSEWNSVSPEELPKIFSTHQPVCWNCHITESFRCLHSGLVTDRPLEQKRTMKRASSTETCVTKELSPERATNVDEENLSGTFVSFVVSAVSVFVTSVVERLCPARSWAFS